MTIEPPESAEKFAERIWQAMQEQYMEEVAELIRLRDLALTHAAEEAMREKIALACEEPSGWEMHTKDWAKLVRSIPLSTDAPTGGEK